MSTNKLISNLANKYDTPLYIYDKQIIETNISNIKQVITCPNLKFNFNSKTNNNLNILKILKQHNLNVSCCGYSDYYINRKAGFDNEQIHVLCNNLAANELKKLSDECAIISIDSIDQLKLLNSVAPGYQYVVLHINSNLDNSSTRHKFGIDISDIIPCINYIEINEMKLLGLSQNIETIDSSKMLKSISNLLQFIQTNNINCQIINFGKLDIQYNEIKLNQIIKLNTLFETFLTTYCNKDVNFHFEVDQALVGNSALLIGRVTSIKRIENEIYIGTDLSAPHTIKTASERNKHKITFITKNKLSRNCHVVGNMCEVDDYLCKQEKLIIPDIGELVVVHDVGANGYSFTSNYNNRLRPPEILIDNGIDTIIRARETLEKLLSNY